MSAEFLVISLMLALIPGTGVLFVVSAALSFGLRGAVWGSVAGAVGVMPHLAAAVLGLSALLTTFPVLYETLRIMGGCYLIWLAVQTWRHQEGAPDAVPLDRGGPELVLKGAMINLLNPKLTLFFMAFLPQFLAAGDPAPATTTALLGSVLVVETLVVFFAYGVLTATLGQAIRRRPGVFAAMQNSMAVLFAGLGLRVLAGAR